MEETPIVISSEHLAPAPPKDPRVELETGMSYAAVVTLLTAVACIVTFAWQVVAGALDNEASIIAAGALVRDNVLAGEVWRLVTSMFLHGGVDHLIGNMLALYVLGMASEHVVGRGRALLVYLLTGVAAGLLTLAMDDRPTVGASGAIFGLLGFLTVLLFHHRRQIVVRENRIAVVLAVWAAYQIVLGFLDPFVANWAHIGGLLSGAALGWAVPPRFRQAAAPRA